jgi:hypothetical protein
MRPVLVAVAAGVIGTGGLSAQPLAGVDDPFIWNPGVANPGVTDPPVFEAVRPTGPIHIDGRLDEASWGAARAFTDFRQRNPDEGAPVSERTEVHVLVDGDALYVGARLYDRTPDAIVSRLGRRDSQVQGDAFSVSVDSRHDHLTAYDFTLSPAGGRLDGQVGAGGGVDLSWDPVWEGVATVDEEGWTAEFRIPLSQLRYDSDNDTWGIQFMRAIWRRQEYAWAALTPRTESAGVDRYAHLDGMRGTPEPRRLEVIPYALGKNERLNAVPGDPFVSGAANSGAAGVDLKYGLGGDVTVDVTVNPDFGQVEADPAVVNLTAFETFYPERRPFFVEGASLFDFGQVGGDINVLQGSRLFYSRRVGRAPQGSAPSGAAFVEAPEQSTIAAAGKVTGHVAGWSMGFLTASTPAEDARWADGAGQEGVAQVEPFTQYAVARARREMRQGNSTVGFMATGTFRGLGDAAMAARLHGDAVVGGLDFNHTWRRRTWYVNGLLAGSRVTGSPEALLRTQRSSARYFQRPDAGHISVDPTRTSLTGWMGALSVGRLGGRHFLGNVLVSARSPGWETNDAGFDARVDFAELRANLTYRETTPTRLYRSFRFDLTGNHLWNFDGDRVLNEWAVGSIWQWSNYWSTSTRIYRRFKAVDDQLTRGGPLGADPGGWTFFVGGGTDPRRPFTANLYMPYRTWEGGGFSHTTQFTLGWRVSPSVSLTLAPTLVRTDNHAQYVGRVPDATATATYGARYLFAELHQSVRSLQARLDWTLTPRTSLQLFVQPLLGSAAYSRFKELSEPGRWSYGVYGTDLGTVSGSDVLDIDPDGPMGPAMDFALRDPDFSVLSLRGNAVFRWEYRPGSTLFLVWQQRRNGYTSDGELSLASGTRDLLDLDPENVFVVKASFWLGR